ncbi:hypothetical protein [Nonomuraea rosea]|uniref:hypothetical protein n=1 Tax=Nonomuraea rosea TaxID=638574 RepID=UPI0031EC5BB6
MPVPDRSAATTPGGDAPTLSAPLSPAPTPTPTAPTPTLDADARDGDVPGLARPSYDSAPGSPGAVDTDGRPGSAPRHSPRTDMADPDLAGRHVNAIGGRA